MTKYSTISTPVDVKERLEKAKRNKEWGKFITGLYNETQCQKSKKAFDELTMYIHKRKPKSHDELKQRVQGEVCF